MQNVENVVIACAGVGSRLGLGLPKALLEISGQSLLSRLLDSTRDVPNVRVVVGYMEHEVSREVFRVRSDAVVVRNPDYLSTSTLTSFSLGCRGLRGLSMFMDGDLIVSHEEFERFRLDAFKRGGAFGHCAARSENPVYVHMTEDQRAIARFSRTDPSDREWASVFCCDPEKTFRIEKTSDSRNGSVFEWVQKWCPLPALPIELFEIDTPKDYSQWEQSMKML